MPEFGEALSGREIDVLKCVADGATNKEVASILDISPYTVKTHLRNIYAKLGAGSRTEAIRVGMEKGVLIAPNQTVNGNGVLAMGATAVPPLPQPPVVTETAVSQPTPDTVESIPQRNWLIVGLIGLIAVILAGVFVWFQFLSPNPIDNTPYAVEELGNKWSVIRDASTTRPNMATTAVGLSIYQIGGNDGQGLSNELIIVDTVESVVSQGVAKPTAVSNAASASLYGEIYVIGGDGPTGKPVGSVEAFSPVNNGWRPITSLPISLTGSLALANQDALFVVGGHDGDTAVATLYKFDLTAERWIELPDMPIARQDAAGGIIGNDLFVVGGENADGILSSCAKFDLDAEIWSSCQDLLVARTNADAVAFFGRLYLFGGQVPLSLSSNSFVAEAYNADTDSWEPIDTPSEFEQWTDWAGLGVNLVGDKIYISGGMINGEISTDTYIFAPFPNRVYLPTTQND